MNELPNDLGPFAIGEVVLLTVDAPALKRRAGDEVTIGGPYTLHRVQINDVGYKASILGWVLKELSCDEFYRGRRIIVQHGEVRRRPIPSSRHQRQIKSGEKA